MSGFQLKATQFSKKRQRESALYNLLQDKAEVISEIEQKPEVDRLINPTQDRTAYLIVLKPNPNLLNLSGDDSFKLHDRHIRIDRDHGVPNSSLAMDQLFTHWHYTERYKKARGEYIEVHVYYHHGLMQGMWKRVNKGGVKQQITELKVLANSRVNTADARKLVVSLLDKTINHKDKLQQEFESLLGQISFEYLHSISEEELNIRLEACRVKCEELNKYLEDYADPRYELANANIQEAKAQRILEEELRAKKAAEESDEEEEVQEELQVASASVSAAKPKKTEKPAIKKLNIDKILANISKLKNDLEVAKEDAVKLLALQKVREDLSTEIMVEYINANNPGLSAQLLAANEGLGKVKALDKYFEALCVMAKLEQVKLLFPHVVDKLQAVFYKRYIAYITRNCTPGMQDRHVKICEFLFEKSSDYRLFLSVSQGMTFGETDRITGETIGISPYLELAIRGRFELFCTLVTQSTNPNIDGVYIKNRALSLLSACTNCFLLDEKYAIFLLNQGAIAELPAGTEKRVLIGAEDLAADSPLRRFFTQNNNARRATPRSSLSLVNGNNLNSILNDGYLYLIEYNSALVALADSGGYSINLLQRLVEHSSIEKIVLAFARVSLQNDVGCLTARCRGKRPLALAATPQQRIQIATELATQGQYDCTNLSIIFGSSNPQIHNFLRSFIAIVNDKLRELPQEKLKTLYDNMFRFGIEQDNKGQKFNAIVAFKAALLITCFRDADLALNKAVLYCMVKLAKLYREESSGILNADTNARQVNVHYVNALQFAEFSRFVEQLADSPALAEAAANVTTGGLFMDPSRISVQRGLPAARAAGPSLGNG